jgi:molybdenum cofactor cytidylyltransferase
MSIAIIILAAGRSSRLGSPKQLLEFNGKSLLQHSIDEAKFMGSDHVLVVLGANEMEIMKDITDPDIRIVHNDQWEEGMASSIRCGINAVKEMDVESVIIMVCDQPYVDSRLLKDLYHTHQQTRHQVVASAYSGTAGTPALFHRSMFDELLLLNGDTGAKKIIENKKDSVSLVGFPEGITDIDTREDYQALRSDNS